MKRTMVRVNIQFLAGWAILAAAAPPAASAPPPDETVAVFSAEAIELDAQIADGTRRGGVEVFKSGQLIQTTITLPQTPENQRDARQIVARLVVEPVGAGDVDAFKPGDPWTRLGSVSVVRDAAAASDGPAATQPSSAGPAPPNEVELLRFITGFGGSSAFEHDLTPFAPLLSGRTTFRVLISTYNKPAWKVTLALRYSAQGAGARRPIWAAPLFNEPSVVANANKLRVAVKVPAGVENTRVWILSTGHASDGTGGDEFVSRTHVLRIDGREVARWRPWAEDGGAQRPGNPMSGHMMIDGRELWSSDLDRSGWMPGRIVRPLRIPAPELSAGKTHVIELEVIGIRPKDDKGHGYWRISATAVGDEPWPQQPPR